MSHGHDVERPLGGKIFTRAMWALLAIIAVGVVLWVIRMFYGLGSVTAQSDGYAWGIWKPLNVVTYTGIGAGAYAVGILTYAFNKGQYHGLVRSAVVVGAMGYTLAGSSVMLLDLGRWWNSWVLFFPPFYNVNSVLLEVALCVMAYMAVLWIEVWPAVLERGAADGKGKIQQYCRYWEPKLKRALPFFIALAITLPTMHQSSLGGLYMVTVTKLHALWHTPWISALFLISCLTMGYGSVVVVENLTGLVWKKRVDQDLLGRMAVVPAGLCFLYLAIRLGDLASRGRLGLALRFDLYGWFFLLEVATFALPAVLLLSRQVRLNRGWLFGLSSLMVFGGALYRFDTYLTAYLAPPGAVYFPSVAEMWLSITWACAGIAVYVVVVKLFPILTGIVVNKDNVQAGTRAA
jgi:Ni/Fe-hydrogenase subunit HybB-like protein